MSSSEKGAGLFWRQLNYRAAHSPALQRSQDGTLAVMGSSKVALCYFRPRAELDTLIEHAWMSIDATVAGPTDESKRQGFEGVLNWLAAHSSQRKACFTSIQWSPPQANWGLPSILAATTSHGHAYLACLDPLASHLATDSASFPGVKHGCLKLLADVFPWLQAWNGASVRAVEFVGSRFLAVSDSACCLSLWELAYEEPREEISMWPIASVDMRTAGAGGLSDDRQLQCLAWEESIGILAVGDSTGNISFFVVDTTTLAAAAATTTGGQTTTTLRGLCTNIPTGLSGVQQIQLHPSTTNGEQGWIIVCDGQSMAYFAWTSYNSQARTGGGIQLGAARLIDHPHTHRFNISEASWDLQASSDSEPVAVRWYSHGVDGRVLRWLLRSHHSTYETQYTSVDVPTILPRGEAQNLPVLGLDCLDASESVLAVARLLPSVKDNTRESQLNAALSYCRLRLDFVRGPSCAWWADDELLPNMIEQLRTPHRPTSLASVLISVLATAAAVAASSNAEVSPMDVGTILARFRPFAFELEASGNARDPLADWWRRSVGLQVHHLLTCALPKLIGAVGNAACTGFSVDDDLRETRRRLLRSYAEVLAGQDRGAVPASMVDAAQRMGHALSTESARTSVSPGSCPICSSSLVFEDQNLLAVGCRNGHVFECCMYSFAVVDLLQTDGQIFQCAVCQSCATAQAMKHVSSLAGLCIFCSVQLLRVR